MTPVDRFRALHEGAPFVIPNPWDAGSARVLAELGFRALATTSSGFAWSLGKSDGEVQLDETLAHVRTLTAVTGLPVSVDLENTYGLDPAEVIRAVAAAGAAGGSIEDWDREAGRIYDVDEAAERVVAAAGAGVPFVLTARAENHIHGIDDLDDTIRRLQAYERAGADVLYAPGLRTVAQIRAVCDAVGKPVNVLARPDLTLAQITGAGAQRVSVGGSLTWLAVRAFTAAATAIRDRGDFSGLTSSGG